MACGDIDRAFGDQQKLKSRTVQQHEEIVAPLRDIDGYFAQLSSVMEVDVMPGDLDPSNYTWPQQPFNRCLFPSASRYASFHCVTNPHARTVGDTLYVALVGSAGDHLADAARAYCCIVALL